MIFRDTHELVLEGRKTVTRRPANGRPCRYRVGGGPGGSYSVQPGRGQVGYDARIRVTGITRGPLGWLSHAEAREEGFEWAHDFERVWAGLYGRYDPELVVDVIRFELVAV